MRINHKKIRPPSRKFKKQLWGKISNEWEKAELPANSWYECKVFRYSFAAVMIIVVVSTVTTSTYAYASDEVTEGTTLYPIKRQIEQIEIRLIRKDENRAKYYVKLMDRREKELQMIRKYKRHEQKTIEQMKRVQEKMIEMHNDMEKNNVNNPALKKMMQKHINGKNGVIINLNQKMMIQSQTTTTN